MISDDTEPDDDAADDHGAVTIDARGLLCPLPVVRLAAAARAAGPGQVLVLLSDDPAAEVDVAAWCRMRGHELLDQVPLPDGVLRHRVRRAPTAAARSAPGG